MAVRKLAFSLVLLALIAFKASSATIHISLHHSHDDDHENHCELCEYAIQMQESESPSLGDLEFHEDTNLGTLHKAPCKTLIILASNYQCVFPFSRPPPSVN